MSGFFSGKKIHNPQSLKQDGVGVYWHSSENMNEVDNESATLFLGASVYLGKGTGWKKYSELYHQVYNKEGWRILAPHGYLVIIQTDKYADGGVLPRNTYLPKQLMDHGWKLIDVKIWKRQLASLYQPPFSQVFVFSKGKPDGGTRKQPNRCKAYFQGVWDFKQTKGGAHNAYPDKLCRLLIEAFTAPGDLIVDPFAGTCRLLGVANKMGRRAIGYEIDRNLSHNIAQNLRI